MKVLRQRIMAMKLIDSQAYYKTCKASAEAQANFGLWMAPGFMGLRKGLLCRDVFDPLIPFTERVMVYDLKTTHKKLSGLQTHFKDENGYHILEMADKRWDFFLPLMYKPNILSTIDTLRGDILIQCLNKDIPWHSIFKYCFGPVVNHRSAETRQAGALTYARQNFDDQRVFVIIDTINSGLESITIAARKELLLDIFDIAANTSDITKHMLGVF